MNIEKILHDRSITVEAFAKAIGVKPLAVYSWMSGKQKICRITTLAIQIYLDGRDTTQEFTKKDWLAMKRVKSIKEISKATGLSKSSLYRLNNINEFNKRIQIILSNA